MRPTANITVEKGVDTFLKVTAVLYGAANALTVCFIGSSEQLLGDFSDPVPWLYVASFVLLAGGVGLLVATLMLRLARSARESGFLLRYAAMALCVCVGGALTGVSMGLTNFVFLVDSSAGNSAISLLYVLLPVCVRGLAGPTGGPDLGPPLAALLVLFRFRV